MRRRTGWLLLAVVLVISCKEGKPPPSPTEPEQGRVKITSTPTGAAVLLDGRRRVGKTPLILQRPAFSRLEAVLVKDGYEQFHAGKLVVPDEEVRIHGVLRAIQGQVVIRTGPVRGANVTIDGIARGKTPGRYSLDADREHVVEVAKAGYLPWEQRVTVKAGQRLEVWAALVPQGKPARRMGWLSLETDQPAMVYLNGTPLGSSPLQKVPLPAGRHTLRLDGSKSKQSKTLSVTIAPRRVRTVRVQLER